LKADPDIPQVHSAPGADHHHPIAAVQDQFPGAAAILREDQVHHIAVAAAVVAAADLHPVHQEDLPVVPQEVVHPRAGEDRFKQ
jgi:hypothetical protein